MKKTISITGQIVFPLKEGSRAIIAYGGDFIYTSRVVDIIEVSEDFAHFETMNSVYKVAFVPQNTFAPLPITLAKCA